MGGRPWDGTKGINDVLEHINNGRRMPQPDLASLEVWMELISCWQFNSKSRPEFGQLSKLFEKFAHDPNRYLNKAMKENDTRVKITSDAVEKSNGLPGSPLNNYQLMARNSTSTSRNVKKNVVSFEYDEYQNESGINDTDIGPNPPESTQINVEEYVNASPLNGNFPMNDSSQHKSKNYSSTKEKIEEITPEYSLSVQEYTNGTSLLPVSEYENSSSLTENQPLNYINCLDPLTRSKIDESTSYKNINSNTPRDSKSSNGSKMGLKKDSFEVTGLLEDKYEEVYGSSDGLLNLEIKEENPVSHDYVNT